MSHRCPLYPRKRTSEGSVEMPAKCQKRTCCIEQNRGGPSAGFHSVLLDHWCSRWCGEEFDERRSRIRLRCPTVQATGKHSNTLDVARQRPKNLDALHGNEFTQLVEADLGLAASDHIAHWFAGLHGGQLCFNLLGDAKLLEHTNEVGAARSGGIGNRFCGKHRLLHSLGGTDVGLRRAGAHCNSDT